MGCLLFSQAVSHFENISRNESKGGKAQRAELCGLISLRLCVRKN
jgi:hypothetical protein